MIESSLTHTPRKTLYLFYAALEFIEIIAIRNIYHMLLSAAAVSDVIFCRSAE